ncbi:hypothetical protein HHI36_010895 [Cryptolaemus montrouzieri]|uniref:protein-tyrosine-phosphatase n=1 Tax=Cryptolaemus montrouzieri TaxID=559131 RepID=A0ABD2MK75_9CUCU
MVSDVRTRSIPGHRQCIYVEPTTGYDALTYRTDLSSDAPGFYSDSLRGLPYFQITSKSKNKIFFKYKLSKPSPLNLEVQCRDDFDLSQQDSSPSILPKKCVGRTDFYCGSLNITGENVTCQLRFLTEENEGGNPYFGKILNFTNEESASFAPENVYFSHVINKNNVRIKWSYPTISNGPITGWQFIYTKAENKQTILKRFINTFMVKSSRNEVQSEIENLSYEPCSVYFLQVRAINNYGPGFAATQYEYSPPPLPNVIIHDYIRTATAVNFSIPIFTNDCSHKSTFSSYLFVLISSKMDRRYDNPDRNVALLEKQLKQRFENSTHLIEEYNLKKILVDIIFKLTVGNGEQKMSEFLQKNISRNEPLLSNSSYNVTFVIMNTFENRRKYAIVSYYIPIKDEEELNGLGGFIVIIIIIILLVVCGWFVYRMWKKLKRRKTSDIRVHRPATTDNIYFLSESERNPSLSYSKYADVRLLLSPKTSIDTNSALPEEGTPETMSKFVKVADFENYIKTSLLNNVLEKQFNDLPKGFIYPCESGLEDVNKPKNRFNNIIAYDHSRVKLHKLEKMENSNYINANFIKGFKKMKAYIATQGPKALTINDFWKMIWQENVKNIVMLVKLEENNQKKVEKYWPSFNQDFQFGKIHVFYHSSEILADYEIRVFKLVCDGSERKISLLAQHFTSSGIIPAVRNTLAFGAVLYALVIPMLSNLSTFSSTLLLHCSLSPSAYISAP